MDLLRIVARAAERALPMLRVLSERERREKSVRDRVWIYSGFIATYYFHGGTSVNGVLVPPGGASGSRILPLAHKPVKLFG